MKKIAILLFTVLVTIIFTGCTKVPGNKAISFTDLKWEFREAGTDRWMPASVPGSVHMDLLENGVIGEPYYRNNEQKYQWIGEKNWEYRTRFICSESDLEFRNSELIFEGLDTFGEVKLNGRTILESNNFFRTWRSDTGKLLKEGENELTVLFKSAHTMTEEAVNHFPYFDKTTGKKEPIDRYSLVRKPAYHYGWDWGPEFLTAGIWKRGFIKFINNCEIEDLFIKQNSVTEKRADLSAIFEIDAPLAQKVVLKLKYGEQKIEKEIDLAEGINKINYDFSITNPDLWWCNGLGKPDLYTFRAEVHVDQEVVAEKEVITGLRSVKVVQKRDGKGSSFYIELNGKPVFMKGANYIPQEMFLNRVKERDYRKLIADSVAANMNMLRVWGGGIYEKNIFYELCDRNGILVWQDFMFACALYPGNTDYLENVKKEAADNIKRLRNHPSIALWCGNNENYIGWRDWGWKKRYSEEDRKKIEADYSRLFDKLLPELVKEYDPGKFYWPSSPLHGWDYPVNSEGDVHNWGVWHGQYPFDYFEKEENIGRFMSEYGFQGAPSPETVKSFTLPKDRDLNSEVMKAHQKHRIGYPVIDKYMLWYYNKPKDFDSWLHVSQLLQGYGIRVGIEAHRRAMPFCMGTLYWQLNDCWPVTSWSGIDSRGEWKALHYKVREAYREILISPVIKGDDLKVFMVSDYYETVKGVLEIEAMDFTGDVKYRTKSAVSLKRNSSVAVITEKIENICGKTGKDGIVVAYRFTSQKGETVNTLRCLVPPKDLRLKNPEIEVETAKDPDGIVIKLMSATFAKGVRLSAETCNVFFSNNYFDLLPGIEFIVKAETGTDIDKLKKNLKIVSLYDTYN